MFKNVPIFMIGLVTANTGLGDPVTELTEDEVNQYRAIEVVSTIPNEASKVLYPGSDIVEDKNPELIVSVASFTTANEEEISIKEVATSQNSIERMENDTFWKDGKYPVILLEKRSIPKKTYIVLDSRGEMCYIGNQSIALGVNPEWYELIDIERVFTPKPGDIKERKAAFLSNIEDFVKRVERDPVVKPIIYDKVDDFIQLSSDAGFKPNSSIAYKIHLFVSWLYVDP